MKKFKVDDWIIHTNCQTPTPYRIQLLDLRDGFYECGPGTKFAMNDSNVRLATKEEIFKSTGIEYPIPTKSNKTITKDTIKSLMCKAWKKGFHTNQNGNPITIADQVDELYDKLMNKMKNS